MKKEVKRHRAWDRYSGAANEITAWDAHNSDQRVGLNGGYSGRPIQLPADVPGRQWDDGARATHMGELGEVPSFGLVQQDQK